MGRNDGESKIYGKGDKLGQRVALKIDPGQSARVIMRCNELVLRWFKDESGNASTMDLTQSDYKLVYRVNKMGFEDEDPET